MKQLTLMASLFFAIQSSHAFFYNVEEISAYNKKLFIKYKKIETIYSDSLVIKNVTLSEDGQNFYKIGMNSGRETEAAPICQSLLGESYQYFLGLAHDSYRHMGSLNRSKPYFEINSETEIIFYQPDIHGPATYNSFKNIVCSENKPLQY